MKSKNSILTKAKLAYLVFEETNTKCKMISKDKIQNMTTDEDDRTIDCY